jgi:hypothetical protein
MSRDETLFWAGVKSFDIRYPVRDRRAQRRGSRTVHRAAGKIRDGRQAAARYQREDSDGTP